MTRRRAYRAGRQGYWQALAWLLERRFPGQFGHDRTERFALRRALASMSERLDRTGSVAPVPPPAG